MTVDHRQCFGMPLPAGRGGLPRYGRWIAAATLVLVVSVAAVSDAAGANIFVTTTQQKISSIGGCSLQEAIYAARFQSSLAIAGYNKVTNAPNVINTQCVAGDGNDTIVLPSSGLFQLSFIVDDADNPFGPTATPIVTSNITIQGDGAQLIWVGNQPGHGNVNARAFAVASTGNLTIQNLYVKGFVMKGGDGAGGGGGGMGAGGAIYVKGDGVLTIQNSTFDSNAALGGRGTGGGDGGGGGLSGNGGESGLGGGGGGGSRGNGSQGTINAIGGGDGGGGGGTVTDAVGSVPGFNGGGFGGQFIAGLCITSGTHGGDASAPGGGGGGGESERAFTPCLDGGGGGSGNYGGGGAGGGSPSGGGGNGGFGGGGGACGLEGQLSGFGPFGGNGGFGGGGGACGGGLFTGGPGGGGFAGGAADSGHGGGGGALGGAIFNDGGTVTIHNSTFTANSVLRGISGGGNADNGADGGGAIFSRNGRLTVVDSTISGNSATGSGGGIVVLQDGLPTSLTLDDTIIANNGAQECYFTGAVTNSGAANLIMSNGTGGTFSACPGVVTTDDPQLGPLQLNGGNTPTMAIPLSSPALNMADAATSLPTDQRGVPRPIGSFSIGAYEPCRNRFGLTPCPPQIAQSVTLTMEASPPGAGSTTPAVGSNSEGLGSVTPITATPSAGFAFLNWTGAIAGTIGDPNSPSTAVIMNQDQTVTANFVVCQPGVNLVSHLTALIRDGVTGDIVATVTINNQGCDAAGNVQVTASTLNTSATSTTLPVLVGGLAGGGGQGSVTLHYPGAAAASGTAGVLRLGLTLTDLATSTGGNAGASFRVTAP